MIRTCRFLGIAAIFLAIGWAAVAAMRTQVEKLRGLDASLKSGDDGPPQYAPRPIAVGCSASRCHGAAIPVDADKRPDETWRWAATVWSMSDAHQRAYEVLGNPLSKAIGQRLGIPKPSESARCLACHSDPKSASLPATADIVQIRSEGVGCRACHGDPSTWFAAHVTWGPNDDRRPEYEKYGMVWMNDLPSRAAVCVKCHVGAGPEGKVPPRDVDHDLIAAGHPRLNFDFETYQRAMPPHWSEKDRRERKPLPSDFAVRAWSAGRLAGLEASLDLLSYRTDASGKHPWPEFSEFNCFDCHHDLTVGGRKPESAGGKRGKFGWYRAAEAEMLGKKEPTDALIRAMDHPFPAKDQVHALIPAVRSSLKAPPTNSAELLRWLAGDEAKNPRPNWDDAAWMYQGLVAVEIDRRRAEPQRAADLDAEFAKLRAKLRLDTGVWNSPHSFDSIGTRDLLGDLTKRMRDSGEGR